MKSFVIALAVASVAIGCDFQAQGTSPQASATAYAYSTENLNAVLWVQTAAEYQAAARQAYALAEMMLDAALADPTWSAVSEQEGADFADLPPAVILDVDETVLDNSPNQARQVLDDRDFTTETWHEWVREERAAAVPGALAFTRAAAQRGVRVFYVTNRRHQVEEPTRRNLAAQGFLLDLAVDTVLTRDEQPDWGSDKGSRRAHVAADHRVLLLIGDNLGDFVSGVNVDRVARQALVERHADHWGRRWIMLPNPQYGSWDGALISFQFSLDRETKRARKLDVLETLRETRDE